MRVYRFKTWALERNATPTKRHSEREGMILDARVDQAALTIFNDICLPAFFLWSNAEFGKAGDEATISSSVITAEESLCFNFWFDLTVSISLTSH